MSNSERFKTQTHLNGRDFHSGIKNYNDSFYPIAIDIGYSAVKGIAPNKSFIFPSYARKLPQDRITLKEPENTDIKYRDESGTWVVGALAYDEVNASEVLDSETELYSRHRYYSPMFKVITRCALGLALLKNGFGGPGDRKIKIQTGLPPAYEKADTKYIKDVMSGSHEFALKIGNGSWQRFSFSIAPEDISVMPQPMGAFMSAAIGKDGTQSADAPKFFNSNVLVADPGFGTFDCYTIKKGSVVNPVETFPEYGMREVFARTCTDIESAFGVEILIPELQNYLAEGKVRVINREKMERKSYDFTNILEKNCADVCTELIEKLKSTHNYFADIDYIIAAGGTYDAWKNQFDKVFENMEDLTILPGNRNDTELSNMFSNVRGYYYWLVMRLAKAKG